MQNIDTAGSKQTFVPTKKTLIFLLLAAVPSLLGAAAVSSVLPLISEAFPDVPESIISLIVTLPPLATALAGFFTGALADKIGPKKVLVCGITLFSLAGGAAFFMNSVPAILVTRVLLGVAMAGIMPMVTVLLTRYYQGKEQARNLGRFAGTMGLGGMLMGLACGCLAGVSWRVAFLIYFICLLIVPGVALFIKDPDPADGTSCKLNDEAPVSRKKTVRTVLLIYLVLAYSMVLLYAISTKVPYLLNEMAGVEPWVSALIVGLTGLFGALGGFVYPLFCRVSYQTRLALMMAFGAAGLLIISTAFNIVIVGLGVAVVGFGVGLGSPIAAQWLAAVTSERIRGKIMGGMSAVTYGGMFVSTFITTGLLSVTSGYTGMYLVLGIITAIVAVLLFVIRERKTEKSA